MSKKNWLILIVSTVVISIFCIFWITSQHVDLDLPKQFRMISWQTEDAIKDLETSAINISYSPSEGYVEISTIKFADNKTVGSQQFVYNGEQFYDELVNFYENPCTEDDNVNEVISYYVEEFNQEIPITIDFNYVSEICP